MNRIVALIVFLGLTACGAVSPTEAPKSTADVQSTAPNQPGLPALAERHSVSPADNKYEVGSIVVDNSEMMLYFVEARNSVIAYSIGVGSESRDWVGTEIVSRKAVWPSWTPTAAMIARNPALYGPHAKGMPGGPKNPLGARALYLGSTFYRIHGTPDAGRIGNRASNGCINMYQSHVIDLYDRVAVGARVYVIQ